MSVEAQSQICRNCKKELLLENFSNNKTFKSGKKHWCKICENIRYKQYRDKQRQFVYSKLGQGKCNCCGEDNPLFLTIDHINGGGTQHRKALKLSSGQHFYSWIIKNNFPSGFQILCMNCNQGKFRNGGVCPHANNRISN